MLIYCTISLTPPFCLFDCLQGVSPGIRREVWKYLLGVFDFASTTAEKQKVAKEKRLVQCRGIQCPDEGTMRANPC